MAYSVDVREGVPAIRWEGPVSVTAEDLLAERDPDSRSALAEAVDFLLKALEKGPASSKAITDEAKDLGIAERTLGRARRSIGVVAYHTGQPGRKGQWMLRLPDPPIEGGQ
jgi:hypothetical protein